MASKTPDVEPQLLSIPTVLQMLTCSRGTLYNLERAGILVPVRQGKSVRYLASEVQAHINRLVAERDQQQGPGRPRSADR